MLWRYLFTTLILLQLQSRVFSSSVEKTPIKHWKNSWVASSAHGTCVAVSCRLDEDGKCETDNCVLLLMRSPASATVASSLQWKPPPSPTQWKELKLGESDTLRILETPMDDFLATSPLQVRSSWTPIGTGAICAMTGLSSDVDHVTRVLQKQIQEHRVMYDPVSFPMPVSGIAQWLAQTVRGAAAWSGGRPFGLQALLVGRQQTQNNNQCPLFVYSVDPSGSWRHWGSGCTAIGRNAEDVRQILYEELQKDAAKGSLNPLGALKVAFQALLQAGKAAVINQDNDQYEAVLIWIDSSDGSCSRVATIDPQIVKSCRAELWETLGATN